MAETTIKKTTLAEDLIKLQAALPVLPKDTSNPFFKSKYTSLDTITELIFPIMTKHNFAWTTLPSFNEAGEPTLKYQLLHSSGEFIQGEMRLQAKSQDPQGQGSAITYARRYAITAVLGLVSDEDDDGNAAQAAAKAAKTIDPPAPEEPSKDVNEELRTQARKLMADKGLRGEKATVFLNMTISKAKPETKEDYENIVAALTEPF